MRRIGLLIMSAVIISGCGSSELDTAEGARLAAAEMVKKQLKVPGSARVFGFPADAKTERMGDTIGIISDSVIYTNIHDTVIIWGKYEAQNSYGVFLPGEYRATLRKDSAGTWVGLTGYPNIDCTIE